MTARCDACGVAAAKYRVTLCSGGRLFLCGHHWRQHCEALLAALSAVDEIEDESPTDAPPSRQHPHRDAVDGMRA